MRDAAARLREAKAKLLEMVDRARNDPAALEGRGDVEAFLDGLESLAQSLDEPEPSGKRRQARGAGGDVVRGAPVTLASPLVVPSGDPVVMLEERVRAILGASEPPDVGLVLDALLQEMKQLDSGMVSGRVMSAEAIAAAYARLNPLACELVERFIAHDRRRARKWLRNLFRSQRPAKLDLGRFEAELEDRDDR